MSIKLINHRLSSVIVSSKRSVVSQPEANLGHQMKILNDNKQFKKVLELFDKHKTNKTEAFSSLIITQALKACAHIADLQRGKTIHHLVSSRIKDDFYILASLIHFYAQCGDLVRAQSLFDTTTVKTLPMYGAMMKGYIKNNLSNKAIELFKRINNPDVVIVILFFNACAEVRTNESLNLTKKISKQLPNHFYFNPRLVTSLLDASIKCGDIQYAEFIFDKTKTKSSSMYGAMMKGYIENNLANKAIDIFNEIQTPDEVNIIIFFNACAQLRTAEALNSTKKVSREMPNSFYSNTRLVTSLLDALMKCGDIKYAELVFNASKEKILSMYGAMMKGYIENDMANKAIDLFNEMKTFDEVIIILFFNACAHLRTVEALNSTKKVSREMPKSFYSNSHILVSLLDALIKCGDSSYAENLFSKLQLSVEGCGNLMSAFNNENNPSKTLDLFNRMERNGVEGNMITYLCVVKALSQIGNESISQSIIKGIPHSYLSEYVMQSALIDMWGKVSRIDQAVRIFKKLSKPNHIEYTAMINSYGLNGMGVQAVELYRQMPLELINEVTHICVLNACSHSGLVDEARKIFKNLHIKNDKIYSTMIDALSRASFFREAQQLIDEYERDHAPVLTMYMALLSGARNTSDIKLSQTVYDRMEKLFPEMINPLLSASILLANVYASSGDISRASDIRIKLKKSGIKKLIGISWTVTNGKLYQFRAHDQSHPRSSEIYAEVEKISKELTESGHEYDSSWITRPLNQDETVASVLCGHSERLAIAWNFVDNPNATQIQVTKNLRVCGDCHRTTKLIAAIRRCEIIVRDSNRIHHFYANGKCSCNDYF